jgi:hypothetical protein
VLLVENWIKEDAEKNLHKLGPYSRYREIIDKNENDNNEV